MGAEGAGAPPQLIPPPSVAPAPFPPPAVARPQTHGSATGALIMALLWIGGFGSALAIFLGLKALREIDSSKGKLGGRGLAAAGLGLGSVGLVLGILMWAGIFVANAVLPEKEMVFVLEQAQRAQEEYHQLNGEYAENDFALRDVGFDKPDHLLLQIFVRDGGYCLQLSRWDPDESTYMYVEDGATTPSDGRCR